MANVIYNSYFADSKKALINLETDNIFVMLVTSTYVPDRDTHTKRSDITNEVTGTGYTAGGQALTSKTVTQNNTNDTAVFTAANVTWTGSTITSRGAVLYKSRGGVATADELIAYIDFVTDQVSSNGDFTIQWNVAGIMTSAQGA